MRRQSNNNWREHPIAIAAYSVAATIGIAVVLVTQLVIPTVTAHLTNQIAEYPNLKKEKANADLKILALEKQLAEVKIRILAVQQKNLFASGNPYPRGYGQVKLGEPISNVAQIYSDSSIKRYKDTWKVALKDEPFEKIEYYYGHDSRKQIYKIVYYFGDILDATNVGVLKNLITEALGTPAVRTDLDSTGYTWKISSRIFVSMPAVAPIFAISDYDLDK